MKNSQNSAGLAVFIQTDTPDFAEKTVPFNTLEEMVSICSQIRPNLVLDKVIVRAKAAAESCAVTLGFIAATQGNGRRRENCE